MALLLVDRGQRCFGEEFGIKEPLLQDGSTLDILCLSGLEV